MSDNLSPVIVPPFAPGPESSTGPESSQNGQHATAADGSAQPAPATDHATAIADPMVADLRSNSAHQQPQQPVGAQQPPQYIFGVASQQAQPAGANQFAHTPAFDPTAGVQHPQQQPAGPFEPNVQQLLFQQPVQQHTPMLTPQQLFFGDAAQYYAPAPAPASAPAAAPQHAPAAANQHPAYPQMPQWHPSAQPQPDNTGAYGQYPYGQQQNPAQHQWQQYVTPPQMQYPQYHPQSFMTNEWSQGSGISHAQLSQILAAIPQRETRPTNDLTAPEIKNLVTDLTFPGVHTFAVLFEAAAVQANPATSSLFTLSPEEADAATTANSSLLAADKWLAKNIRTCLDSKAEEVRALCAAMAANPRLLHSGAHLWSEIKRKGAITRSSDYRAAATTYRKKRGTFFRMGQTGAAVRIAASELEVLFKRLKEYTGELSLIEELIENIPLSKAEESGRIPEELWKKRRLQETILQAEIKHADEASVLATIASKEELIETIVHHVQIDPTPPSTREASAADAAEATRLEALAAARRQPPPGSGIEPGDRKCSNCGENGHAWRSKKCSAKKKARCGVPSCPCVVGKQCAIKSSAPLSKGVTNALGQKIFEQAPKLWERMQKLNCQHRGVEPPITASAEAAPSDEESLEAEFSRLQAGEACTAERACDTCDDDESTSIIPYTGMAERAEEHDEHTAADPLAGSLSVSNELRDELEQERAVYTCSESEPDCDEHESAPEAVHDQVQPSAVLMSSRMPPPSSVQAQSVLQPALMPTEPLAQSAPTAKVGQVNDEAPRSLREHAKVEQVLPLRGMATSRTTTTTPQISTWQGPAAGFVTLMAPMPLLSRATPSVGSEEARPHASQPCEPPAASQLYDELTSSQSQVEQEDLNWAMHRSAEEEQDLEMDVALAISISEADAERAAAAALQAATQYEWACAEQRREDADMVLHESDVESQPSSSGRLTPPPEPVPAAPPRAPDGFESWVAYEQHSAAADLRNPSTDALERASHYDVCCAQYYSGTIETREQQQAAERDERHGHREEGRNEHLLALSLHAEVRQAHRQFKPGAPGMLLAGESFTAAQAEMSITIPPPPGLDPTPSQSTSQRKRDVSRCLWPTEPPAEVSVAAQSATRDNGTVVHSSKKQGLMIGSSMEAAVGEVWKPAAAADCVPPTPSPIRPSSPIPACRSVATPSPIPMLAKGRATELLTDLADASVETTATLRGLMSDASHTSERVAVLEEMQLESTLEQRKRDQRVKQLTKAVSQASSAAASANARANRGQADAVRAARSAADRASALAAAAARHAAAANKRANAAAAQLRRAERRSTSKPQPTQRAPWRSPIAVLALAALCGPLALWACAFVSATRQQKCESAGYHTASAVCFAGEGSADCETDEVPICCSASVVQPAQRLAWIGGACFTPTARRNLLAESWLLRHHGAEALKREGVLRWPDGYAVPLIEHNGLYFVDAHVVREGKPHLPMRLQIDGGSNVNFINDVRCRSYGEVNRSDIQVAGIGAAADVAVPEQIDLILAFGHPQAKPEPEASAAAVSADDPALLWACRLATDADGVIQVARAVHGVKVAKVSKQAAEVIDRDMFLRMQRSRRNAVPHATAASHKAASPGEGFILDGFGVHTAQSPIDKAVYELGAVCSYSSYGYSEQVRRHTVADWMAFLKRVVAHAKRCGHDPKWVRFDRAPELDCDSLKLRIEDELGLHVELAPRRRHEGVGAAEVNNDILTRMAEGMLQRCGKGTAWLLPARAYAQYLLNRRPKAGKKETRFQVYERKFPDLSVTVPLLFGTSVLAHETKEGRGPKGSLEKPRAIRGTFYGIEGNSYLVHKLNGATIHAEQVDPLDELQLMRRGIPAGGATTSAASQTDVSHDCKLQPTATRPEPQSYHPMLDLVLGARVSVKWHKTWYDGTVVAIHTDEQRRLWEVSYDNYEDTALTDFETTQRAWERLPEAPPTPEPEPTQQPKSPVRMTRQSARALRAAVDAVEATVQAAPMHAQAETFAAAVYQHLGDAGLQYAAECHSAQQVTERRVELVSLAHGLADGMLSRERIVKLAAAAINAVQAETSSAELQPGTTQQSWLEAQVQHQATCNAAAAAKQPTVQAPTARAQRRMLLAAIAFVEQQGVDSSTSGGPECSKATQAVVDVTTELGKVQYRVPKGKKELEASPQRERWLLADRAALSAILMAPGNCLVRITEPIKAKVPIARCVTARRIKVDQSTGKLDDKSGFKSRHACDRTHIDVAQAERSKLDGSCEPEIPSTASIVDDMCLKMLCSDAACRDRNLTKGDVGNAYSHGERKRPVGYMALPATLPMFDEDGTPLCIRLATPMWGEGPAGYEWQLTFNKALTRMGWRQSETVPALFHLEKDGNDATLVTIVDDFLISESGGYAIADATIAALRSQFGTVTTEREPGSFAGYKVARDRRKKTLTLSMTQKVVEAAREHAPGLLDGSKLDLPGGKKLMDMADGLQMPQRDQGAKLNGKQVKTQRVIGSLKFIEKVMPKLSLPLHRLSCVMAYPPPDALTVALATLAIAYKDRAEGLTYGGGGDDGEARLAGALTATLLDEPAPAALEASADATWGDRNVVSLLITRGNGTVAHSTKKLGLMLDSSMEAESIGSSKAGESITYAREIERAMGVYDERPTVIMTDNKASLLVANDSTSASRSRHFLRRYWALQQRIASGACKLVKADDAWMPADFLTKWLSAGKLAKSIAYATNRRNAVVAPDARAS